MFNSLSLDSEGPENYFCLLSGETPTLPAAEVEAILESEREPMIALTRLPRVIRLRSTLYGASAIARRAAYTRKCCREILVCVADEGQILEAVGASHLDEFIHQNETFKVEVVKAEPEAPVNTKKIERTIGQAFLDRVPGARVNLGRNSHTILGVFSGEFFVLGLVIEVSGPRFVKSSSHSRPFFHPSAMQPKLARCMVNLSRVRQQSVFLDPFCGTGSHLVEAALMGCSIVGSDIDPRMVRGTSENILFSGVGEYHLLVADARAIPFKHFDACASDPPYGRGSSTHGVKAEALVERFLAESFHILSSKDHICLSFPESGNITALGEDVGYEVRERHLVREHKSLTREVVVFTRP